MTTSSAIIGGTRKSASRSKVALALLACGAALAYTNQAHAGGDLVTVLSQFSSTIEDRVFTESDGDVIDGCITAGRHRVLRFGFHSRNAGNGDVVMGFPPATPIDPTRAVVSADGRWIWSPAHHGGHWHLKDFNFYDLTNASGGVVTSGLKQAFCLMDSERWNPNASGTMVYNCGNQGVSAGWQDNYGPSLACQFMTMDNVPNGTYRLLATTNVSSIVKEDNFLNNSTVAVLTVNGNAVTLSQPSWQAADSVATSAVFPWGTAVALGQDEFNVYYSDYDSVARKARLFSRLWSKGRWFSPTLIQGEVPSGEIRAAALARSQDAVAFRRSNGALRIMTSGRVGSGWVGPTGQLASAPAVTSTQRDRADIFYRGTDNSLYSYKFQLDVDFPWSTLTPIKLGTPSVTTLTGNPAAVSREPGRAHVFSRGANGALFVNAWDGTRWGGFVNLGGTLHSFAGDPVAVALSATRLDVFAVFSDGNVWTRSLNGAIWSAWTSIGGGGRVDQPVQYIRATASGQSTIHVTVRSPNNLSAGDLRLWHRKLTVSTTGGSSWSAWTDRGLTNAVQAAISMANNRLDVFYSSAAGLTRQVWY